jgi:hypothetical protein
VVERFGLDEGQAAISALRKAVATPVEQAWAPVISVPNVLELSLCRELIELYESNGGEDSGFMRDVTARPSASSITASNSVATTQSRMKLSGGGCRRA